MLWPNDLEGAFLRAGWRPGRKIHIPGTPGMHTAAKKFLEEYGNLSIRRSNLGITLVDWFDFNWERAGDGYHPEVTKEFEQLLGRPLFVVGECDCAHTVILMDDLGRFFRDCDTVMHIAALNEAQLFYNLWNGPDYDRTGFEGIGPFDRKVLWNKENV